MPKVRNGNKISYRDDPARRKELAEALYKYRSDHSMSQEQLAHLIGASVFSICRWERSKHYPSRTTLKLMKMLGVL